MSGRRMKKGTMIVLILFIYMLGMGIWGYNKGTVDGVEVICYIVGMSVLLAILVLKKVVNVFGHEEWMCCHFVYVYSTRR